jgi:CpeT/CpcT family (DUF1001)
MTHSTDIATLTRWMASEFSNQTQAYDNPPLFAHIRVCMRPLPFALLGGVGLFLEQAYDFALNDPYRIRVIKLFEQGDRLELEHYLVKDEKKYCGASRQPEMLQTLTLDQLDRSVGCNMVIHWTGDAFKGVVEPGKGCRVNWRGTMTYLDNEFEVTEDAMMSLDRGRDLETDEPVWGSKAGAFQFQRCQSFADEVQLA